MMLVFKFCKEEEKGKQNVSRLLAGSSCFKSDQASNLHPRVPQFSPLRPRIPPGSDAYTLTQELCQSSLSPPLSVPCKER